MLEHARVVVIGGGVVGCSVLYHLAKAGWTDILLIERSELTSGSTWHAAGGMHTLNSDPNVAKLQAYTINLYQEIEELSGQATGVHITGGVMLAGTEERMDYLRHMHAKGRNLGMDTEIISVAEAKRRYPLMEEKYFVGALYDPMDGHGDPSGITNAYAKAARIKGASIERHCRVTDLKMRAEGGWDVITEKGNVVADHVVNAGGLWAREVGRMVGLELPVLAMEHHYLLTEEMEEVVNSPSEIIHAVDFEGEIYMRQEGKGMLMGTYEKAATPWSPDTTPWDFGHELLQENLERIAPSLEVGFKHFPAFERAGIRKIINGPFTFAPDGNPLIGPIRGLPGYWCACGVMAGFSQGGGVGLALANWITEGDPGFDIWAMDVARFGDWAGKAYTHEKVCENYSRRFQIVFPNEELPAGRPLRRTPIYSELKRRNAVFGSAFGLEHALWFAPKGTEPVEQVTFKRSNAFPHVAEECKAVRERVGLIETSSFAKYAISGPGAEAYLSKILAGRIPQVGRMALAPMLNEAGNVIGDFTLARIGDEQFRIFGSGVAEDYHMRYFSNHLPESGVTLTSLRNQLTGLSIAGPRARDVLAKLAGSDIGANAMPFLSIQEMHLGKVPALVGRITFTGDLGFEIWVGPDYQLTLFESLMAAGEEFGIQLFGGRALNSLRVEKSFGSWATEFRPIYGVGETGLDKFVAWKRGGFIGHEAALNERNNGPARQLACFSIQDAGVDVLGDEPIWFNGEVKGWVTSGGYAHHSQSSLALGYIPSDLVGKAGQYEIEILGDRRPATQLAEPAFDPTGGRMRG